MLRLRGCDGITLDCVKSLMSCHILDLSYCKQITYDDINSLKNIKGNRIIFN